MESFGNEKRVQQGEDWNLDLLISARSDEYIPYIVSNQLQNPCFVVTVASTKYEKNKRYVKSWWNSLANLQLPTFYGTNPIYCGELVEDANLPTAPGEMVANTFKDENGDYVTEDPTLAETQTIEDMVTPYLYQYTKEEDEIDKALGHKPYYYFRYDYNKALDTFTLVEGYECKLTQTFLSQDTQEWTGQNYAYQITLVDGPLMDTKIDDVYAYKSVNENVEDWPVRKAVFNNDILPIAGSLVIFKIKGKFISNNKVFTEMYFAYTDKWYLFYKNDVETLEVAVTTLLLGVYSTQWLDDNYKIVEFTNLTIKAGPESSTTEYAPYLTAFNNFMQQNATYNITRDEHKKLCYDYIKSRWPDIFQPDIDEDSYLGEIITPIPILRPTKIEVMNNLRRLI